MITKLDNRYFEVFQTMSSEIEKKCDKTDKNIDINLTCICLPTQKTCTLQ